MSPHHVEYTWLSLCRSRIYRSNGNFEHKSSFPSQIWDTRFFLIETHECIYKLKDSYMKVESNVGISYWRAFSIVFHLYLVITSQKCTSYKSGYSNIFYLEIICMVYELRHFEIPLYFEGDCQMCLACVVLYDFLLSFC